jgi:restriction system protein
MPVPDFQSLMRPLLEAAKAAGGETSIKSLAPVIATTLNLNADDLAEMLPSGKQTAFMNRLHWAKTFLDRAKLVNSTRRGYFLITQRGADLLASTTASVSMKVLELYPEYAAWRAESTGKTGSSKSEFAQTSDPVEVQNQTPEEVIGQGVSTIEADIKKTLLERMQAASPAFFERVVVDLLVAMGFGGGKLQQALVTGKSGDGGIDGVVQQDALGLDAIYVQAKRYATGNTVGRPDIQKFVGSMTGESATKGVFVTTSAFSAEAKSFIEKVQQRIVLIDGERFAELALRHGVGVRTRQTIEIKTIDEDYFEDDI